jgi:hypothetical protein
VASSSTPPTLAACCSVRCMYVLTGMYLGMYRAHVHFCDTITCATGVLFNSSRRSPRRSHRRMLARHSTQRHARPLTVRSSRPTPTPIPDGARRHRRVRTIQSLIDGPLTPRATDTTAAGRSALLTY